MKKTYYEAKKTIHFPAWEYDVNLVLSTNVDASAHRRDKNHKQDGWTSGMCMRSVTGEPKCLVILPYQPRASTVAHEAWHAVKNMLDYCGADYESETVAYHLGYLVREIAIFEQNHPRPPKHKRPNSPPLDK